MNCHVAYHFFFSVLADANFPATSICKCGPVEIRADGMSKPLQTCSFYRYFLYNFHKKKKLNVFWPFYDLSYTVWKRSHVDLLWFYRTNNNYFVNYGNHCIFRYLLAPEFLNMHYLYSKKSQMFVTDTAVQGDQVYDLFYSLSCRYTRTSEGNTEAFSSWYLWWFGGW